MNEQDKTKERALSKYKQYVKCELERLNDGCLDISEFDPEPPINTFSEDERKELQSHFKNLRNRERLIFYCNNNGIDLNKYPNIKGLF